MFVVDDGAVGLAATALGAWAWRQALPQIGDFWGFYGAVAPDASLAHLAAGHPSFRCDGGSWTFWC